MRKKTLLHIALSFTLIVGLAFLSGCASMALHGGSLVSRNDSYIQEYLVTYRAEGAVPEGQTYHLVRTEKGLAVFEQAKDGSGALFETLWEDSDGDHFASWIYLPGGGSSRHGYEFVVPKDRTRNALRYVYPWGTYRVQEIDGIKRPVPANPVEPVATLIPVG